MHEQEHYLSRELELMLDRLESPAWNLAHQSEQASLAQAPIARVPAAYHPKVGPLPPTYPPPLPMWVPMWVRIIIPDHIELYSAIILKGVMCGYF